MLLETEGREEDLQLLILQNLVGWTNDTAYGGYGQKVVLMFGSSTSGSGRLVEFKTY